MIYKESAVERMASTFHNAASVTYTSAFKMVYNIDTESVGNCSKCNKL